MHFRYMRSITVDSRYRSLAQRSQQTITVAACPRTLRNDLSSRTVCHFASVLSFDDLECAQHISSLTDVDCLWQTSDAGARRCAVLACGSARRLLHAAPNQVPTVPRMAARMMYRKKERPFAGYW